MSDWKQYFHALTDKVGSRFGTTDWFTIDQQSTDIYAALIDDLDYMHNDPTWDRIDEFGGTIAIGTHGLCYVLVALNECGFPSIGHPEVSQTPTTMRRVRFVRPLRVGHQVRVHTKLTAVRSESASSWLVDTEHTIERRDEDQPFVYAELQNCYTLVES